MTNSLNSYLGSAFEQELPLDATKREAALNELLNLSQIQLGERVIQILKWMVALAFILFVNFITPAKTQLFQIDLIIAIWLFLNFIMLYSLSRNKLPKPEKRDSLTLIDLILAGLVSYFLAGFAAPINPLFYLAAAAAGIRNGPKLGLGWGFVCVVGYITPAVIYSPHMPTNLSSLICQFLLIFVTAFVAGLVAQNFFQSREKLVRARIGKEEATLNEITEVDKMKTQFIMLASHELRTPISKIKGWLSLMDTAGERMPSKSRQEGVTEMVSQAEHLQKLTDNLLRIAQLDAGEVKLKPEIIKVEKMVQDALELFPEQTQQRVVFEMEKFLPEIIADQDRLSIVLVALVDNAIKFSPSHEPITIRATINKGRVKIAIKDMGKRIPDDQIERVFASFYQVESPLTRQREGFGIGLYMARQLIERMGGTIGLDNSGVRGNTFFFILPAAKTWHVKPE